MSVCYCFYFHVLVYDFNNNNNNNNNNEIKLWTMLRNSASTTTPPAVTIHVDLFYMAWTCLVTITFISLAV